MVWVMLNTGARRRGHRVFDRHVDDEAPVRRLVAAAVFAVGRRFRRKQHDVARLELVVNLDAWRLHSEDRHRRVAALIGRHQVIADGRRRRANQFGFRRLVRIAAPRASEGRGKQLVAVDDGHHAVISDTPRGVDTVTDDIGRRAPARQFLSRLRVLERGDRTMQ